MSSVAHELSDKGRKAARAVVGIARHPLMYPSLRARPSAHRSATGALADLGFDRAEIARLDDDYRSAAAEIYPILAERMHEHGCAISASQVWRICQALDLKPWQTESWMTSHDPDFWEKAADVCGLYLNDPEHAVVWSVDEKSQVQAKSRVNPTKPARPGTPRRRDHGYKRHGTVVLFAGLNVHDGDVAGWVTDSTRSTNFVEFLGDLVRYTPEGLELHCIVDNLSAHSTPLVEEFLEKHRHVFLHHTPTHASWLNQVELFFSIIERRLLRNGEFNSTDELADRIIEFIKAYNRKAAPFRWTYDGRPLKIA